MSESSLAGPDANDTPVPAAPLERVDRHAFGQGLLWAGDARWRMAGAVTIGPQHLRKGEPGGDAIAATLSSVGSVVVLCDGAGSSAHGPLAAALTCLGLQEFFQTAAVEPKTIGEASSLVQAGLQSARRGLETRATELGQPIAALASTVLGAVFTVSGAWLFHLGDGAAFALTGDGRWLASQPERGEYANETWFLCMEQWEQHLRFTEVPGAVGLILMSDGVSPFALGKNGAFQGFLDPLLRALKDYPLETAAEAFLKLLTREDIARAVADDKSVLCVVRQPAEAPSASAPAP